MSGFSVRICTCIRDLRDVRVVVVFDPDCPHHVILNA